MGIRTMRLSDDVWKGLKEMKGSRSWDLFFQEVLDRGENSKPWEAMRENGQVVIPKDPEEMPDTLMGRGAKEFVSHSKTCKCALCV